MRIDKELELIYKDLELFWQKDFLSDEEDDFENLQLKQRIMDLIERFYTQYGMNISNLRFRETAKRCLLFLGKNTGCASDYEIAEKLIEKLVQKDILDKSLTDFYYQNENTARQG